MGRISGRIAAIWAMRTQRRAFTKRWGSETYPIGTYKLHIAFALFYRSSGNSLRNINSYIKEA